MFQSSVQLRLRCLHACCFDASLHSSVIFPKASMHVYQDEVAEVLDSLSSRLLSGAAWLVVFGSFAVLSVRS